MALNRGRSSGERLREVTPDAIQAVGDRNRAHQLRLIGELVELIERLGVHLDLGADVVQICGRLVLACFEHDEVIAIPFGVL